ncbi:MAG: hypothetical protein SFW08_08915 [Gemmatimonadaceae bacterium]|nr:hypothetical protein [Gemmatimonadaceae bacterium]
MSVPLRSPALLLATLLLAAACADPTAARVDLSPQVVGAPSAVVSMTVADDSLVVHNGTRWPVHFLALDGNVVTVAAIAPCTRTTCPGVAAHSTRAIPLTQVIGYHSGSSSIVVTSWAIDPETDQRIDRSMHVTVLPLTTTR